MKKFILSLMILSLTWLSADNFVLVTNAGSHDVSIIDADTLSTVTSISTGLNPTAIAVSPNNKTVVVCNAQDTFVSVISFASTFPLVTNITVPAGSSPAAVAITPDSTKAFVMNQNGTPGTVSVIDLTTTPPSLLQNIIVSAGLLSVGPANENPIIVTPDGKTVFAANLNDNLIMPIDVATLTHLTDIPTAQNPVALAITPDQKTLLAVGRNDNAVTAIDIGTQTPITTIPVGLAPLSIAIDRLRNKAYTANSTSNTVTPIDLNTLLPLADIPVGNNPFFVGISPDNNMLYTANFNSNSSTPIDISGPTPTPLTDIPVGSSPLFCVFTSGKVFIINDGSNNVTPIDIATRSPLTNILVGTSPALAAVFIPISSPLNFSVASEVANSLFQKDLINKLSWSAPTIGTPAFYKIYRDSNLTDLVAEVNGCTTTYHDHARKNGVVYTYFIVAIDGNGNISSPVSLSFP